MNNDSKSVLSPDENSMPPNFSSFVKRNNPDKIINISNIPMSEKVKGTEVKKRKILYKNDQDKLNYEYQDEREIQMGIADFLEKQTNINFKNYEDIFKWFINICDLYNQDINIVFNTRQMIDRYLNTVENISFYDFQLLSMTCFYLCIKLNNLRWNLEISLDNILDNAIYYFENREILDMEIQVLDILKCDMIFPTIKSFLDRYLTYILDDLFENNEYCEEYCEEFCDDESEKSNEYSDEKEKFQNLVNYVSEIIISKPIFCKYSYSLIATSIIYFCINKMEIKKNNTFLIYNGYEKEDFEKLILIIGDFLKMDKNGHIRNKYKRVLFDLID